MLDLSTRSLQLAAAAYLLLVGTSALNFWRSAMFVVGGSCALFLLAASWRRLGPWIPSPGNPLLAALTLWCAWSCASLLWSVDPAYTAHELKREVGYSLVVMATFYVAATTKGAWSLLLGATLAGYAAVAAVAVGLELSPAAWDAGALHGGVGAYSTYSVLVAPLVAMLLAPAPAGFGRSRLAVFLAALLLLVLVETTALTYNRFAWPALAAVCLTVSTLAARRWRAAFAAAPVRWLLPVLLLLAGLGALFVGVVQQKSLLLHQSRSAVATLAGDPRLALWEHAVELIEARPWTGYGFGKLILQDELREALGDPVLNHAHNLLLNHALQLGLVGSVLLVVLFAALAWRFVRFVRSADDAVAAAGIAGLGLLVGFVVKNITDDFLLQSNAKELWAFAAMLLGFGAARSEPPAAGTPART